MLKLPPTYRSRVIFAGPLTSNLYAGIGWLIPTLYPVKKISPLLFSYHSLQFPTFLPVPPDILQYSRLMHFIVPATSNEAFGFPSFKPRLPFFENRIIGDPEDSIINESCNFRFPLMSNVVVGCEVFKPMKDPSGNKVFVPIERFPFTPKVPFISNNFVGVLTLRPNMLSNG